MVCACPELEAVVTNTPEMAGDPRSTLRTRIMTELRRAPNGLDPDDVYAYVVRLQARIDFLERQVRECSNAVLLDATLKQAAEIRRQALEAAERAWTEIVQAACEEAARQREEALRDAARLLDDACAEIRDIHDRLQVPAPAPISAAHEILHGADRRHRAQTGDCDRPGSLNAGAHLESMRRDSVVASSPAGTPEDARPFLLPSWIEE